MNYTVYADRREGGFPARVLFEDGNSAVTGKFMLTVGGDQPCVNQTATLQNANVDIQTEAITPAIEADVEQGDVPEKANGMDVRTDLVDDRIYSRLIGNTFASVVGERRCGSDDVCEFDLLFQSFTVVEPRFAHGHPQTHTHSRYLVTFIRGLCALLL